MAFVLSGPVAGTIDPNIIDSAGGFVVFKQVEIGSNPAASALLAPRPFSLFADGTTNGDDTENAANSLFRLGTSGAAANGSSLVVFPANSGRVLTVKVWARRVGATDIGYAERKFLVVGAATPVVRAEAAGTVLISAARAIPVSFEQVAAGGAFLLPILTAEVGGVFVNVRNVVGTTDINAAGTNV